VSSQITPSPAQKMGGTNAGRNPFAYEHVLPDDGFALLA
jgi:hypothetical protein